MTKEDALNLEERDELLCATKPGRFNVIRTAYMANGMMLAVDGWDGWDDGFQGTHIIAEAEFPDWTPVKDVEALYLNALEALVVNLTAWADVLPPGCRQAARAHLAAVADLRLALKRGD